MKTTITLTLIAMFILACSPVEWVGSSPPTETRVAPTLAPTVSVTVADPHPTIPAIPTIAPTPVPDLPGRIQRLSRASNGQAGNGDSHSPAISADGRWVAFVSRSDNLVTADDNVCQQHGEPINCADIFLHDRQTGRTERISQASDGRQSNGDSFSPVISADGQWIAYTSQADNLVVGDTNETSDVFLFHRQSGVTRRISMGSDGTQADGRSFGPQISPDGRFVAFTSQASSLVFGDTNQVADVFVYGHENGTISRVSLTAEGEQSQQSSLALALSNDGQQILFAASGSLTAGTDSSDGLFLHDRLSQTTQQIVQDESGLGIFAASMSADARLVAYQQFVGHWDIFVQDVETQARRQINLASDGSPANFDSFSPVMSADGRWVAFSSRATNLVPHDDNGVEDIFVHEVETGRTQLISRHADGTLGNGPSEFPMISPNGQWVIFTSAADNLLASDQNGSLDVFLHELAPSQSPAAWSAPTTAQFDLSRLSRTQVEVGFPLLDVAISPNAEKLAISGVGGAGIYSLPDITRQLFWWNTRVDSVTWSPDGHRLATTDLDGSVPVWAASTGGKLNLLGILTTDPPTWKPQAAWSPSGEYVASNSIYANVYVWRVVSATADIMLNESGASRVNGLAWRPDERMVAVSDSAGVRLWQIPSKESRLILPNKGQYAITDLAWSASGDNLAFSSQTVSDGRGRVHVWQAGGKLAVLEGPTQAVQAVSWSPDGWLVSGGADGLWIWDLPTARPTIIDGLGPITSVDWSADGRYLVAGTEEGIIYMWTVE